MNETEIAEESGKTHDYTQEWVYLESNTTRAARAAQGCTDNGVRVDTGTLRERRSGEERRYRNN